MNEQDYLAQYDRNNYDQPLVSVDSALFTFAAEQVQVLLVERSAHPERGKWALPGGFIDLERDTDLAETAKRKLCDKTGVTPPYLEQLCTVGNAHRDPRGWSVTICYTAMIGHQTCAPRIGSVNDARWVPVEELDGLVLAFDHSELIAQARERLRQKALYSIVPAYALSQPFTIAELMFLHEQLIGKPIQRKSFQRRIAQSNLLIDTGEKRSVKGRPAGLYRLKEEASRYTFVRNLEE